MDIIKHFEIYIAAQKATGVQVAIFGGVLLVSAILLHFSKLNPITQGLRNSLFVLSILLLVSGAGFILNQNKLHKTKIESYQASQLAFKTEEIERMKAVDKSVPRIILGLSVAIILVLLIMIFFINQPLWKGVAFGLIIYFLGLVITESISYLSVRNYLESLLDK